MHAHRRLTHLLSLVVLLALASGITGCRFGNAGFSGDFAGRTFDPGGTVFAYVDENDDDLVNEARPRVAIVMTWVVFDPTADLNDFTGSELEDIKHEAELRDALALIFDDQGDLTAGASFTSIREGNVELEDGGLEARVHFSPERLDASSNYAGFQPFASRAEVNVDIENVSFADGFGKEIRGAATIALSRTDTDAGDAKEGAVTGTFVAPLVDERIAEQNLSLLGLDALLGVPLPPRDDAEDDQ